MYVAVKGGEAAIDSAHKLLAQKRRGDLAVSELSTTQIKQQLSLAVDRVMTEGSLYDQDLAALALKQAMGDSIEAIFLLRAYRTTLPRFGFTKVIDTSAMRIERRISAIYKDIPGGQALGPTFDYTHRLLDFSLLADEDETSERQLLKTAEVKAETTTPSTDHEKSEEPEQYPRVLNFLQQEDLLPANEQKKTAVDDITREPLDYPSNRSARLQQLTRADEGFLLSLGYSTQRGYGRTHPFAGEIRMGYVDVAFTVDELGFDICLGEICISECEMINQFAGSQVQPPQFTQGYGISFGFSERKTLAMALVDRALQARELGESVDTPAASEEFVLSHCDNVEASGFVSHLKLPHYVDFQSELALVRKMRKEYFTKNKESSSANNDTNNKTDNDSQKTPIQQKNEERTNG
jgi:alpha-D-ribose 1-methylphosphonate 5-triphosphate synthase subunit PhnI